MTRNWMTCWAKAGFVAALTCILFSTQAAASEQAGETKQDSAPGRKYVPPKRGAPKVRISSASRGDEEALPSLYVLAPDHAGLTVRPKPRLFWYQSSRTGFPIAFSLSDADAIEPELEFILRGCRLHGQVPVSLEDFGVSLETDTEYRWVVAIVPNPDKRSRDVIAEGRIVRAAPSDQLLQELNKAVAADHPPIYAQHGIWYDALSAINELVDANPESEQWRRWRSTLLREVELFEPAVSLEEAPSPTRAEGRRGALEPNIPVDTGQPEQPVYVPSHRGAPGRLISSASRVGGQEEAAAPPASGFQVGSGGEHLRITARHPGPPALTLSVLLPEQGGFTTREQPSLFWYISERVDTPINLRVVDQRARQPLCDLTVRHSDWRGIQRLDLAKFGISLSSGQDYAWTVGIVLDPKDRSKDVAVAGRVRRLPLSEKLRIELNDTEKAKRPAVLAAHGLWCDAFATLSDIIEAQPANAGLRQSRANLLRQVGLDEAAASEPTGE